MICDRKWFVSSVARQSGHRSLVGPFDSATDAAKFAEEERKQHEWRNVAIYSRSGRRR